MKKKIFDFSIFEEPDYSGNQITQDFNLYSDDCNQFLNHHTGLYKQRSFGSGCYQRKKVSGIYDSTDFDYE